MDTNDNNNVINNETEELKEILIVSAEHMIRKICDKCGKEQFFYRDSPLGLEICNPCHSIKAEFWRDAVEKHFSEPQYKCIWCKRMLFKKDGKPHNRFKHNIIDCFECIERIMSKLKELSKPSSEELKKIEEEWNDFDPKSLK